jgi:hypothetical protein
MEPAPKRAKCSTALFAQLECCLADWPKVLLPIVEQYAPNYFWALTDDFLERVTVDYFTKLWPTKKHIECFNIPTLARTARPAMEQQVEKWSELWDRQTWSTLKRIYEDWKFDDQHHYYMDKIGFDFQWTFFWRLYPLFAGVDRMFELSAKDHLNGDCLDSDLLTMNEDFFWKLADFAFRFEECDANEEPRNETEASDGDGEK